MPLDSASEIVPGLWMSGSRAPIRAGAFERVLTLCAVQNERAAVPEGTDALAWRFPDAQLEDPDSVRAWARQISAWMDAGETVLVRCAAGLNRSGLVVARTLIERGLTPTDAVLLVRERRRADALNNPWFVEWLRGEGPTAGDAPRIPLPRHDVGAHPITRRFALDAHEVGSSVVALLVSGGLWLGFGHAYLARGVVGALVAFGVMAVPLLWRRLRLRHEAVVCLVCTGVVHALGVDWPLRVASSVWWTTSAVGLAAYVGLRRLRLPPSRPRQPPSAPRRTSAADEHDVQGPGSVDPLHAVELDVAGG